MTQFKIWQASEIKMDGKVIGFDIVPENSRKVIALNAKHAVSHLTTELAYAWEDDMSEDAQPPFGHPKFNWNTIEIKVEYLCDAKE